MIYELFVYLLTLQINTQHNLLMLLKPHQLFHKNNPNKVYIFLIKALLN